jgi:hypothetical protein
MRMEDNDATWTVQTIDAVLVVNTLKTGIWVALETSTSVLRATDTGAMAAGLVLMLWPEPLFALEVSTFNQSSLSSLEGDSVLDPMTGAIESFSSTSISGDVLRGFVVSIGTVSHDLYLILIIYALCLLIGAYVVSSSQTSPLRQ